MSVSGCRIVMCRADAPGRPIHAQRVSRSAARPEDRHIERQRGSAGVSKRLHQLQEEACQSRSDTALVFPAGYSGQRFVPSARRSISEAYDGSLTRKPSPAVSTNKNPDPFFAAQGVHGKKLQKMEPGGVHARTPHRIPQQRAHLPGNRGGREHLSLRSSARNGSKPKTKNRWTHRGPEGSET